jgi:hypothetical protein
MPSNDGIRPEYEVFSVRHITVCGVVTLYGTRYPPILSRHPAIRTEDRIAISLHFYNRMSGSFRLGHDDHYA